MTISPQTIIGGYNYTVAPNPIGGNSRHSPSTIADMGISDTTHNQAHNQEALPKQATIQPTKKLFSQNEALSATVVDIDNKNFQALQTFARIADNEYLSPLVDIYV